MRLDGGEIAALDGPVNASAGPRPNALSTRRLDERRERVEGNAARRREPLDLTDERDEVVRGHDRGRVVARAVLVGELNGWSPSSSASVSDLRVARDRGPRPGEPLEPDGGRGERLQRVQRADAHVGALLRATVEDVEAARTREVHDERARFERRTRPRAQPTRSTGPVWR